ncbi:MAG: tetratricopeptide repeat protein, partial [Gemmatimonadota bacterium]
MSDIARLKNQGRQHEGREEWSKAIEAYVQAIRLADSGGVEADLSLYNRVGDLYQKVGQTQHAVESWDKGVDAYMDAGFYNNAIALCNKILRTVPSRNSIYLKLGQISARKGFLSDARKNILEYAQRMQRAGQLDEAFRALAKFADLQPEPEIRLMLADQLLAHQRISAGVDQLRFAWRDLVAQGRQSDADDVRARILELAPDRDPTVHRPEGESRTADSGEMDAEGIIDLPELEPEEPRARAAARPGPAAAHRPPESDVSGVDLDEIELEPSPPARRDEPEATAADVEPEAMEIEGLEATSAADESTLEDEGLSVSPAAGVEPAETEIERFDIETSAFEFETFTGEGVALGSSGLGELGVEEDEQETEAEEGGGATIEAPEGLTFDVGAFDFDFSAATEETGAAGAGLDLEGGPGAATDEPTLEALEAVPVVPP